MIALCMTCALACMQLHMIASSLHECTQCIPDAVGSGVVAVAG